MRALPEPYLGSSRSVADVSLLFPAFTTACLLLSGLKLISLEHLYNSMAHSVAASKKCCTVVQVFSTIVTVTMQAGPSLDMGLSGASGQGLPAQGMVYCSTVLEPFAYTA